MIDYACIPEARGQGESKGRVLNRPLSREDDVGEVRIQGKKHTAFVER